MQYGHLHNAACWMVVGYDRFSGRCSCAHTQSEDTREPHSTSCTPFCTSTVRFSKVFLVCFWWSLIICLMVGLIMYFTSVMLVSNSYHMAVCRFLRLSKLLERKGWELSSGGKVFFLPPVPFSSCFIHKCCRTLLYPIFEVLSLVAKIEKDTISHFLRSTS